MDIIFKLACAYALAPQDVELLACKLTTTTTELSYSLQGEAPISVSVDDLDLVSSLGFNDVIYH